jgi:hypothetical protein
MEDGWFIGKPSCLVNSVGKEIPGTGHQRSKNQGILSLVSIVI